MVAVIHSEDLTELPAKADGRTRLAGSRSRGLGERGPDPTAICVFWSMKTTCAGLAGRAAATSSRRGIGASR